MISFNFGTPTPIPYRLPDLNGTDIYLRALGRITAETDDKTVESIIRNETLLLLSQHLSEHSGKSGYKALRTLHIELGKQMSEELTAKYGFDVSVAIQSITPDSDSQALIDKLQKSQAEEAIQNMTIFNDDSYKGDCVPPPGSSPVVMPMGVNVSGEEVLDGGYAGRFENPAKTGFIMPQVMQPDVVSSGTPVPRHQPKFCPNCGYKLPDFSVNFCPDCGNRI